MFQFFDVIIDFFSTIWNAVTSVIADFVSFVGHVVKGSVFIGQAISDLPPFCHNALMAILGISIVTMFISALIDNA